MGLSRVAGLSPPGVPDMSALSSILAPDAEAQGKYEAMGLPDPVAFAALTALGAIPNPMELLNSMMLAAQDRLDAEDDPGQGDLKLPSQPASFSLLPGKSFVEAFNELQRQQEALDPLRPYAVRDGGEEGERLEERLAKSAKELAEQARLAADRAKEVALSAAQMATANRDAATAQDPGEVAKAGALARGVAQAFASVADDDDMGEQRPTRPLQTLSSLLTGRANAESSMAVGFSGGEKIAIGKLPPGVTESAVRLESARHGAVTSVILEADGSTAYVTFAAPDMAANAVRRMNGRVGLLGSTSEAPQVKLISEVPDSVRLATLPTLPPENLDAAELPEHLKPLQEKRRRNSRTKKKSKSRQRRKRSPKKRRNKSRDRDRWLDRSRSNSHTATGQYIRATGCSSTVRWWEKKESSSSASSRSASRGSRRAAAEEDSGRPRQVAVKGIWAQFVQHGGEYYYNMVTGRTTWDRPADFDLRRPREASAKPTGMIL